ncbi:MAG: NYN domain-containing protein [Lacipirellulaceae bacterium]
MRLLIDGYNLLHASDLFGSGSLAGTLRGSREALLEFLSTRLDERERRTTVIVFDAAEAPLHLPDSYSQEGIAVRFARGYPSADALLEEVLAEAKGTRNLTVVSGDRRVQRAARSRGATPVDSEPWFRELAARRPLAETPLPKPTGEPLDNAHWVRAFSDAELDAEVARAASPPPPPDASLAPPASAAVEPAPPKRARAKRSGGGLSHGRKPLREFGEGVFDPFPPGYGEDLLDGDA